jgi:hypothetical protein
MTLRIVTTDGIVTDYPYEEWQAPRLAKVLAAYWSSFIRVTLTEDNVTWIIKP